MCFFSRSGYRPFINRPIDINIYIYVYEPTPVPKKSTFRYNSMFNFIPVSFCFLLILGLVFRVRDRVRVWDR